MLIDKAFSLAAIYHHGQVRKYTGEPYIVHPVEVMALLSEHLYFGRDHPPIQHMLAAALLHDVLEDTYATEEALGQEMPGEVVDLVVALTDVPHSAGNRATRKAMDRERLASAGYEVQTIKCADIISNSRTINRFDPRFRRVYRAELLALMDVLRDAHPAIWCQAHDSLNADHAQHS
jgi:(p)ppGpp synthase/HD superfamily hydrolase